MAPHLALALTIKEEIIETLEQHPDLTPDQIGDLAYQRVLETQMETARDEVVANYEQAHRRTLYTRLLEEIDDTEGRDISEQVRTRVETDVELATELRESARRELAARAIGVVRDKVTEEQQTIIDGEAERQIVLDRLDVQFAHDGVLDVSSAAVVNQLQPGDRLVIYALDPSGEKKRLVLKYDKDVNNVLGWVFDETDMKPYRTDGYAMSPKENQFITVGHIGYDMNRAEPRFVANQMQLGMPIALRQGTARNPRTLDLRFNHYQQAEYSGTDFQTKTFGLYNDAEAERV